VTQALVRKCAGSAGQPAAGEDGVGISLRKGDDDLRIARDRLCGPGRVGFRAPGVKVVQCVVNRGGLLGRECDARRRRLRHRAVSGLGAGSSHDHPYTPKEESKQNQPKQPQPAYAKSGLEAAPAYQGRGRLAQDVTVQVAPSSVLR
jgi:hypothetical protein